MSDKSGSSLTYSGRDSDSSAAKATKATFTTSPENRGDERKAEPIGGAKGKSEILTLNLQTLEYEPKSISRYALA